MWEKSSSFRVSSGSLGSVRGGCFQPQDLVDAARKPKAPLHPLFEWDNRKAAEEHRLSQARNVLRSIRVVMEDDGDGKEWPARAYLNVRQSEDVGGYMVVDDVMSDPVLKAQALSDCRRLLKGIRRRYAHLKELASLWGDIDELEDD